jgi:hypothetical protein
MRIARHYFGVRDETEALDLRALPAVLDRVDSLVEGGVLAGPSLNAADFQTAPSLALLSYRLDIREQVESRPSWRLAEQLLPATAG